MCPRADKTYNAPLVWLALATDLTTYLWVLSHWLKTYILSDEMVGLYQASELGTYGRTLK